LMKILKHCYNCMLHNGPQGAFILIDFLLMYSCVICCSNINSII
jgi:hypothetical protein